MPLLPLNLVLDLLFSGAKRREQEITTDLQNILHELYIYPVSPLLSLNFLGKEIKKKASNGFCYLKRTKPLRIIWLGCFSLALELLEMIFYFVAVIG